jgi:hypothetical protein
VVGPEQINNVMGSGLNDSAFDVLISATPLESGDCQSSRHKRDESAAKRQNERRAITQKRVKKILKFAM